MLRKRFLSLALVIFFLVLMVVSVVTVSGADALYISDMQWIKATSHVAYPVVRDANIIHGPLKLAGVTYSKGFGLVTRDVGMDDAELQVLIPEGYNYFEAIVGFDDAEQPYGSAEFKVLVDGVLVETTGIVLGGSGAHTISAEVTPGSTLSLVTTNGGDTAAYDAADWCNAALYKREEPKVSITSPKGIIGSTNITVNGTWNYVDSVKIFAGGVEKGEATLSQNGTWTYALQLASTDQTTIEAKGFVDGVEATSNQITVTYVEQLFISDMQWIKATSHVAFPVVKDANMCNGPMIIGTTTYTKGFGLGARDMGQDDAELQVLVPEGYNYFEAVVGFDAIDQPFGTAEFKVLVDGVQVATTGIVSCATSPGPYTISANVTPGSTLSLITTNGGDTAAFDTVDWCNAALYNRTEPKVAITSPTGSVGSSNVTVKGTWSYVDAVKIFAGGVEKGEATLLDNGTWTYELQIADSGQIIIEARGIVAGQVAVNDQVTVTYAQMLYISDMEWIKATCHSAFAVTRDATMPAYGSTALTLNGVSYTKGFCLVTCDTGLPDAQLQVAIPQGYKYFEVLVGIDDLEPATGTAEFKILVDGVQVATTGLVSSGSGGHKISADVSEGSILTLVTTNGGDSAACDLADWCNAALYTENPNKELSVLSSSFGINGVSFDSMPYFKVGDILTYETNIDNPTSEDNDAMMFLVMYDNNNKLIKVCSKDLKLTSKSHTEASQTMEIDEIPSKIKAFVWSSELVPIVMDEVEEYVINNSIRLAGQDKIKTILCTGDSHTWGQGATGVFSSLSPAAQGGDLRLVSFAYGSYVNLIRNRINELTGSTATEIEATEIAAKTGSELSYGCAEVKDSVSFEAPADLIRIQFKQMPASKASVYIDGVLWQNVDLNISSPQFSFSGIKNMVIFCAGEEAHSLEIRNEAGTTLVYRIEYYKGEYAVINSGIGSCTSQRYMSQFWSDYVSLYRPEKVLMEGHTINDWLAGYNPTQEQAFIEQFIEKIKKEGAEPILLTVSPIMGSQNAPYNSYDYSELITASKTAANVKNIEIVDANMVMKGYLEGLPEGEQLQLLFSDNWHPNDLGHSIYAENAVNSIFDIQ